MVRALLEIHGWAMRRHCDEDHGLGDIEALFIISYEAPPSGHPAEGAFHHPSARQDLEAFCRVRAPDDLDGEVQEPRLVHQLGPVVGAISEQVLDPRPALADRIEIICPPALSEMSAVVRWREAAVGVDGNMALPTNDLFPGVISCRPGVRRP